jgi:allantoinase
MVSQVEEFPAVTSQDIALAMSTLKDTPTTLMFHAEIIPPIGKLLGYEPLQFDHSTAPNGKPTSYNTFLQSRPPVFETYAVESILSLAKIAPRLHLHIVHLSATECIPILQAARARGINITAETCFHYLALAAEDIKDGDTRHKCCPPIRPQTNQDRLWAELSSPDSCVQTVVSDHSPCTPELKLLPGHLQVLSKGRENKALAMAMKCSDSGAFKALPTNMIAGSEMRVRGNFLAAWGGISSVGLGLPILHSAATSRTLSGERVPSIVDMVRLCSQATARQVGLSHRKGGLKEGMDADVCVFDDTAEWTLDIGGMRWKNKCSPWEGYKFMGRVEETWLRGVRVFQLNGPNQGFLGGKPTGEAILEKRLV